MRTLLLIIALLLSPACVTRPPVKIETEHGVVRAASMSDAERVAEALTVAPQLRAKLEAVRVELPEVWVRDRDIGGALGVCRGHRIDLESAGDFVPVVVAHELVHWYMDGSPFEGAPFFIQEGMADYLSLELAGLVEGRTYENQVIGTLKVMPEGLDADARTHQALPEWARKAQARLGFEVVSRIGLQGVRPLAVRGAGGWSYVQAAGLEPEESSEAEESQRPVPGAHTPKD